MAVRGRALLGLVQVPETLVDGDVHLGFQLRHVVWNSRNDHAVRRRRAVSGARVGHGQHRGEVLGELCGERRVGVTGLDRAIERAEACHHGPARAEAVRDRAAHGGAAVAGIPRELDARPLQVRRALQRGRLSAQDRVWDQRVPVHPRHRLDHGRRRQGRGGHEGKPETSTRVAVLDHEPLREIGGSARPECSRAPDDRRGIMKSTLPAVNENWQGSAHPWRDPSHPEMLWYPHECLYLRLGRTSLSGLPPRCRSLGPSFLGRSSPVRQFLVWSVSVLLLGGMAYLRTRSLDAPDGAEAVGSRHGASPRPRGRFAGLWKPSLQNAR